MNNNTTSLLETLNVKKRKENDVTNKKNIELNKDMVLEHYNLNFDLEENMLDYLNEQTLKIHSITSKAYSKLGKIFKETQDELANNKTGVFRQWFESIGYNRGSVYRLIDRYKYIDTKCDDINWFESLPISLSYEISNPNCPEDLRDMVINGEIKTLKEFKKAKNELIEVVEKEPTMADTNIFEVIKTDYNEFRTKVESFEKFIIEDLEKVETGKQEKIAKEIEEINKRIDKLMKSL